MVFFFFKNRDILFMFYVLVHTRNLVDQLCNTIQPLKFRQEPFYPTIIPSCTLSELRPLQAQPKSDYVLLINIEEDQ